MRITDQALCIHNTNERHASQFEKVDLLPVTNCHFSTLIGQANKREILTSPIFAERRGAVRAEGENLGTAAFELRVVITQARQLCAAVRSHEAA